MNELRIRTNGEYLYLHYTLFSMICHFFNISSIFICSGLRRFCTKRLLITIWDSESERRRETATGPELQTQTRSLLISHTLALSCKYHNKLFWAKRHRTPIGMSIVPHEARVLCEPNLIIHWRAHSTIHCQMFPNIYSMNGIFFYIVKLRGMLRLRCCVVKWMKCSHCSIFSLLWIARSFIADRWPISEHIMIITVAAGQEVRVRASFHSSQ